MREGLVELTRNDPIPQFRDFYYIWNFHFFPFHVCLKSAFSSVTLNNVDKSCCHPNISRCYVRYEQLRLQLVLLALVASNIPRLVSVNIYSGPQTLSYQSIRCLLSSLEAHRHLNPKISIKYNFHMMPEQPHVKTAY